MALVALCALQPLRFKHKKPYRSLKCGGRRKRRVISNAQVALKPYDGQRIWLGCVHRQGIRVPLRTVRPCRRANSARVARDDLNGRSTVDVDDIEDRN
jgi:hypothetical protein